MLNYRDLAVGIAENKLDQYLNNSNDMQEWKEFVSAIIKFVNTFVNMFTFSKEPLFEDLLFENFLDPLKKYQKVVNLLRNMGNEVTLNFRSITTITNKEGLVMIVNISESENEVVSISPSVKRDVKREYKVNLFLNATEIEKYNEEDIRKLQNKIRNASLSKIFEENNN